MRLIRVEQEDTYFAPFEENAFIFLGKNSLWSQWWYNIIGESHIHLRNKEIHNQ